MKIKFWRATLVHFLCTSLLISHSNLYAATPKKSASVKYRGSESFMRCQDILGQDWNKVIANPEQANNIDNWIGIYSNKTFPKVEGGESSSNFNDPERFVYYVKRESEKFVEYFNEVQECMALAVTMTHVDLSDEDDTMASEKGEFATFDNAIRCTTAGAETQDFPQCRMIVNMYNTAQVAKVGKDVYHQVSFAEKTGDAQTKALANPMDATGALKAQKTGIEAQHEIAEQNAVFEGAKLATLGTAFSKMPTRKDLHGTCTNGHKDPQRIRTALSEKLMEALNAGAATNVQKVKMEAISLKETIENQLQKNVEEAAQALTTSIANSGCATVVASIGGSEKHDVELKPFFSGLKSAAGMSASEILSRGQVDDQGDRAIKKFDRWACPDWESYRSAVEPKFRLKNLVIPKNNNDVCKDSYNKECDLIEQYQDGYIQLAVDTFKEAKNTFVSNNPLVCDKIVNSSSFDLIKNEKAKDSIKQVLVNAGVDMAKYTGMALILNDQENKMNRAINGVTAFKPADFSYNLTDELATLCQMNPSARECLGGGGGQVGLVGTEFNIGGNGQATEAGKSLQDGDEKEAAANALTNRSDIPFGGVSVSDGSANQGGGLTDRVGAVGIEKKAAGAGGAGAGGGVGSVAAPSNSGAGAQGQQQPQGLSPLGNKGQYGGGGSGSLAYGGGGGSGSRKPASNENPFADMMKGKNAGGGELNFRDPASSGVGDKGRSLFNMISTRYSVVNKDKRLAEYVEAK